MRGQNLMEQYLASKGFVVLAINYRGGSGFGREFQDLAVEDWLGGQATRSRRGGGLPAHAPLCERESGDLRRQLRRHAVDGRDHAHARQVRRRRADARHLLAVDDVRRHGPARKDLRENGARRVAQGAARDLRTSSTILRFDAIKTPLLITHGELDDRAPYKNYVLAVAELKKLGKTFESRSYPGEGHGFRNPDNQIDMYTRLENFFKTHLGECTAR